MGVGIFKYNVSQEINSTVLIGFGMNIGIEYSIQPLELKSLTLMIPIGVLVYWCNVILKNIGIIE